MASDNYDELWRQMLEDGVSLLHAERFFYRLIPSDPRCSQCKAPFGGSGGKILRNVFRVRRSNHNPSMCNLCDHWFQTHPGGAEAEIALMFADVRGSTKIAERMSPVEFSQLMDRFYTVATTAIVRTDGLIEKFVGDEAAVMYFPGLAGPDYTRRAIEAAQHILELTGHRDPVGPWLPVGVGVHRGRAYVGVVGSGGVRQLTVLGDIPNTVARLASVARQGEVFISEAAYEAGGRDLGDLERRELELKGKDEPFGVRVLTVMPETAGRETKTIPLP